MKTFVTADLHLNHRNIIKYCQRPFKDVDDMNNCLVNNWNMIVAPTDIVYHIGDFCFKKTESNGYRGKEYWESKLNGDITFIRGNHDKSIGIKSIMLRLFSEDVLLQHNPPYCEDDLPPNVKLVLCGHVHDKWVKKNIGEALVINVGTDVWGYRPVELANIINCS